LSKHPYNSALKGNNHIECEPSDFEQLPDGIIFRHDIISDGIPHQMIDCDFIYAEPPWPHGFKTFNERAGVHHNSYNDLAEGIANIIEEMPNYIMMPLGKTLLKKLPEPTHVESIQLNGNPSLLAHWHNYLDHQTKTTEELLMRFGSEYDSMGDFTCGYGAPVWSFLDGGGQTFVASDFDGCCVTVMASILRSEGVY
tara:strand:- start:1736 stop:2326 length:591 start_codon:yes stop_codon:yes gene_type:complete